MSAPFSLRFKPSGPVGAKFMASRALVRAIMGPVGSAKTSTCLVDGFQRACMQTPSKIDGVRYYKRAVVRDTYRNLESTTIPSWHTWFPKSLGEWNGSAPMSHHIVFDIGFGPVDFLQEFIALGDQRIEDVMKGWEGTDIYLNEADRLSREALIYAISRVGRYPSNLHGKPTIYGVTLDFNAPDTENWAYEACIGDKMEGLEFFRQPSGFSPQAENIQNLPDGYYDKMAVGQPDWFVRRMIRNEFGYSREGQPVYPEYSDTRHVANHDLEAVPELGLELGADAGGTPALIIGQTMPNGQRRILDEVVPDTESGIIGPSRFSECVNQVLSSPRYKGIKIVGAWADPSAAFGGDKQGKDGEDASWLQIVSAKTQIAFRAAPTNKLTPRLDAVRGPLTRSIDGDTPAFLLSPRCKILRKGFNSTYRYRKIVLAGESRYNPEPEKNEASHPHDGLQYLMLGGGEYAEVMGRKKNRGMGMQAHIISGD
jgi:hypothetical protein